MTPSGSNSDQIESELPSPVDAPLVLSARPSPADRLKAVTSLKASRGRLGGVLRSAVPVAPHRSAVKSRVAVEEDGEWAEKEQGYAHESEDDDGDDPFSAPLGDPLNEPVTNTMAFRLPSSGKSKRFSRVQISFLLMVVLPTALVSLYLYAIASPHYVSEFHFSVQSQQQPLVVGNSSASASPSGAVAAMTYLANNYVVIDYLQSEAVLDDLSKRIDLDSVYANSKIDWWSRMRPDLPIEKKLSYWQNRIYASFDLTTGIGTVKLSAFSAEDSQKVAKALAELSEQLINDLQTRSQKDAVNFFEGEVHKAEDRLRDARNATADFRDREQMAAPEQEASNVVALIAKLDGSLTGMRGQLTTLRTYMGDTAPSVVLLKKQIAAVEDQLAKLRLQIGATGTKADSARLSNLIGKFDALKQNEAFAEQLYQSSVTSLEMAKANAAMQHAYVATFVPPRLAEANDNFPRYPATILIAFLLSAFVWFVGTLVTYAIRDHAI